MLVNVNFFLSARDNLGYTQWAPWSLCTATCGFDEVATRRRECIGKCFSKKTADWKSCGLKPCPSKYKSKCSM